MSKQYFLMEGDDSRFYLLLQDISRGKWYLVFPIPGADEQRYEIRRIARNKIGVGYTSADEIANHTYFKQQRVEFLVPHSSPRWTTAKIVDVKKFDAYTRESPAPAQYVPVGTNGGSQWQHHASP